jgi:hypothetical protein
VICRISHASADVVTFARAPNIESQANSFIGLPMRTHKLLTALTLVSLIAAPSVALAKAASFETPLGPPVIVHAPHLGSTRAAPYVIGSRHAALHWPALSPTNGD